MARAEYEVRLESADNGIIVRVGCKTLIVPDEGIDEALTDIKQLLIGGWKAQKELRKKWLNDIDECEVANGASEPPALTGRPIC